MKKLADTFFKWFCNPAYYEDIKGDLEELFAEESEARSPIFSSLLYFKEVLLLLRWSLINPALFSNPINTQIMIKNNVKIGLRHMLRQKWYSLIKMGSLAIGIAAFLIISIYILHQLSYDNFYPQNDRIYRVTTKFKKEGFYGVDFPAPFSRAIVADFPEVGNAARFIPATWLNQLRPFEQTQNYFESKIAYVDPSFMEILERPVLYGNCTEAMKEPNTIILSRSKAEKFFAGRDPIKQELVINNNQDQTYKVVGVFEDFPSNSHLEIDIFISLEGVEFWPGEQQYWGANMYDVYTMLNPDTDVQSLNAKLSDLTTNYFLPSWIEREFADPEEIAANIAYELQPIDQIYLDNKDVRDRLKHGDKSLLWLFGLAGILIVVIAGINFVNLSVARFTLRIKEVSLKKVLGASRKQLIHQFLTEFVLFSFFSILIGFIIAQFLLPVISDLAGFTLRSPINLKWTIMIFLLMVLMIGLATGIYPSIFLSSFKPSSSKVKSTNASSRIPRNVLVIFQFAISSILIICTIGIYQQMSFIVNKDIGYEKEQVLIIHGTNAVGDKIPVFKERLKELGQVQEVTVSDYLPVEGTRRYGDSFWRKGEQNIAKGVNAQIWEVDPDYMNTLGIQLLDGRNFNQHQVSDTASIILSKSLANKLLSEGELGTQVTNKNKVWKVIGVMDDFHFESLKTEISPICLVLGNSNAIMAVKLGDGQTEAVVESISDIWATFVPNNPFRYEFLDESFSRMHFDVSRSATLFNVFAGLAIFIACLGLFGLSTFNTFQRKKEIGIRKILGASTSNIVFLMAKKYLWLVSISIFVSIPIGWHIIQSWLEGFAYRISIQWWVFLLSAVFVFLLVLFTISSQSLKVALANPASSIKDT